MLEQIIKQVIAEKGSISVAEFFNLAMYHDQYGYYKSQQPFGSKGDFITAPEISQMFGEILAVFVLSKMAEIAKESFNLVELGPGRGTLMDDMLRVIYKSNGSNMINEIHMIEASDNLAKIQQQKLAKYKNIFWHKDISALPKHATVFVANELIDALAVEQYKMVQNKWHSIRVVYDGEFKFDDKLETALELGSAGDGAIIERCYEGEKLVEHIAQHVQTYGGAAALIDYGYIDPSYVSTLQSVINHKYNYIFDNIGMADLTFHVDFARLSSVVSSIGCNNVAIIEQGEFLKQYGIDLRLNSLLNRATERQKHDLISQYQRLVFNDQMGSLFKFLIFNS